MNLTLLSAQARRIIDRACTQASASDFGTVRLTRPLADGLERTLDGFARLPLRPGLLETLHDRLVEDLANRLRIEQWHRRHPEAADTPLEGPLLVCGLPRTGTTATVGMLALDPQFRFLRAWEAMQPLPPAGAG